MSDLIILLRLVQLALQAMKRTSGKLNDPVNR
jgi:hypothetical protein